MASCMGPDEGRTGAEGNRYGFKGLLLECFRSTHQNFFTQQSVQDNSQDIPARKTNLLSRSFGLSWDDKSKLSLYNMGRLLKRPHNKVSVMRMLHNNIKSMMIPHNQTRPLTLLDKAMCTLQKHV